jgi:hypothetical protein
LPDPMIPSTITSLAQILLKSWIMQTEQCLCASTKPDLKRIRKISSAHGS